MDRRTISSPLTLFYKYVFPTVWLGGFCLGAVLSLVRSEPSAALFLAVALLGAALLIPLAIGLKQVAVDETSIYVYGARGMIAVPLSDIESVEETLVRAPRTVIVRFRSPTRFGSKISYIPPLPHPTLKPSQSAEDLRLLASNARIAS